MSIKLRENYDIPPILGIIIPCYNEEEGIGRTVEQISHIIKNMIAKSKISTGSFILFVDDGSTDRTFEETKNRKSELIRIVKLSKNEGHQYALLAGIHYVDGKVDCAISIDADLQDDLTVIEKMIDKYMEGYEIVLGVRKDRSTDSLFKRYTARFFYFLMKKFGANLVKDHADFRLLSSHAITQLTLYKESNFFLRGVLMLLSSKITVISYAQGRRVKGKSKYNLKKMISLAIQGITSFSTTPIRLITILGFIIFVVCLLLSIHVLFAFVIGDTVPGWASITLPLYFLGGIQMLSIGIVGEYIGKIYQESKRRPHYHIEEIIE